MLSKAQKDGCAEELAVGGIYRHGGEWNKTVRTKEETEDGGDLFGWHKANS